MTLPRVRLRAPGKSLPFRTPEELNELADTVMPLAPAAEYPYFAELASEYALKPGYSYGAEFAFGLDLILDGVERGED